LNLRQVVGSSGGKELVQVTFFFSFFFIHPFKLHQSLSQLWRDLARFWTLLDETATVLYSTNQLPYVDSAGSRECIETSSAKWSDPAMS
jgi:hypothetical protein